MPHDVSLIATVSVGFALAFPFGFIAHRLRLPPLVGYLMAGVVMKQFLPGFAADKELTGQLAEIGVMLLMFGVGLHFSTRDLMAVRRIAIPGAIAQIIIATGIGTAMAMYLGWSLGAGLVLGLSLSVASTVVLLKALEERNAVTTPNGRIAVGWLVVEDLVMVLMLVLLPAMAEVLGGRGHTSGAITPGLGLLANLGLTLLKMILFVALALRLVRACCHGCCVRWRVPVHANSSLCRYWRWHWASRLPRPSCLAFRSHWALSLPAWC